MLTGSNKKAYYYQTPWTHQTGRSRIFGPSSAHSGDIVLHGYGDGHGKPVNVSVETETKIALP